MLRSASSKEDTQGKQGNAYESTHNPIEFLEKLPDLKWVNPLNLSDSGYDLIRGGIALSTLSNLLMK